MHLIYLLFTSTSLDSLGYFRTSANSRHIPSQAWSDMLKLEHFCRGWFEVSSCTQTKQGQTHLCEVLLNKIKTSEHVGGLRKRETRSKKQPLAGVWVLKNVTKTSGHVSKQPQETSRRTRRDTNADTQQHCVWAPSPGYDRVVKSTMAAFLKLLPRRCFKRHTMKCTTLSGAKCICYSVLDLGHFWKCLPWLFNEVVLHQRPDG